jgi:NitT/TauT family transport system substrate-binding protein
MTLSLSRRRWLGHTTALTAGLGAPALLRAQAAPVKIRFQLDWRADGQAAPFFYTLAKGYFAQEGLDVSFDVGSGSAMAVNRVASGVYDMGYGDVNALIEFLTNTPNAPSMPQAVYMVLESTPAAVMSMTRSNIAKPGDLAGKTLGAPPFDAGRKLWPLFAKLQGLAPDAVKWSNIDPALREVMLVKGQVDAVTGFQPSGLISAIAAGAKEEELRIFHYKDFGVNVYGNAILTGSRFQAEQPAAVAGFLRAYNRGLKETMANYDEAIRVLKVREPIVDAAVEMRRLRGLIEQCVLTPTTKAQGLGEVNAGRLAKQITDVAQAFNLPSAPKPEAVFNPAFLPAKTTRMMV